MLNTKSARRMARMLTVGLVAAAIPQISWAQAAAAEDNLNEIIVTAQKREQSVNTVGITITAATADMLRDRNITEVADLPRLVPGFTVQQGAFNSTSFTLRGIGFFNSDLGSPPAVSVYVDEAPLPYPAMTKLAAFDLERVEVLKGPQGTLFGQNATGGLVNYIAGKPTDTLTAGIDASYGRFNRVTLGGFVAGPLSDSVGVRLAVQGRRGDAWQYSITRPGDKLGKIKELQGRGTIDFHPEGRWTSRLTFTATHDGSDNIGTQFIGAAPVIPGLTPPGFLTFPVVTKPRSADWNPTRYDTNTKFPYDSNTNLYQATWRNDYEINDDIKLTSLTSYSHFSQQYGQDNDGTPYHIDEVVDTDGEINSFFQEIRLSGKTDKFTWLVGANYDHDVVKDGQLNTFRDKDVCQIFTGANPDAYCDEGLQKGHMKVDTYAIYARADYDVTDKLNFEAAIRFNDDNRTFDNCGIVVTTHHGLFFDFFQASANGGAPIVPSRLGHCWVLDPATNFQPVENVHKTLNQNSTSWRVGVNFKAQPGTLLYANISKGYKAGTVPVVGAATVAQFAPVTQESVLAYEAGFKASLFDRKVQFNGAGFYYDYKHKQLRGSILDPAFGALEALVSIPKSRAYGAEMQLVIRPVHGLVIDTSATYVDTKIKEFTGFDSFGVFRDMSGSAFPFSPKWQSNTDISYTMPVTDDWNIFGGASLTYNSKTFASVGGADAFQGPNPPYAGVAPGILDIDSYALIDLRAGVESADGRYRIWAWGKNVANKYYWNNVFAYGNTITRYVGQPATWGLTFNYRFK